MLLFAHLMLTLKIRIPTENLCSLGTTSEQVPNSTFTHVRFHIWRWVDELLGAWLFFWAAVPSVPYSGIFLYDEPGQLTYWANFVASILFVVASFAFVYVCYPSNHHLMVRLLCLSTFSAQLLMSSGTLGATGTAPRAKMLWGKCKSVPPCGERLVGCDMVLLLSHLAMVPWWVTNFFCAVVCWIDLNQSGSCFFLGAAANDRQVFVWSTRCVWKYWYGFISKVLYFYGSVCSTRSCSLWEGLTCVQVL